VFLATAVFALSCPQAGMHANKNTAMQTTQHLILAVFMIRRR
jgi:hypothetical protein